jgi:hypothetical protein
MTLHIFQFFKAIAKQLSIVLLSLFAVLCIYPTAAFAALENTPIETPGLSQTGPDENLAEMQQQRREWQSQVSESRENAAKAADKGIVEKLNLDELLPGNDRPSPSSDPDTAAKVN